jgi:hypothetical protein
MKSIYSILKRLLSQQHFNKIHNNTRRYTKIRTSFLYKLQKSAQLLFVKRKKSQTQYFSRVRCGYRRIVHVLMSTGKIFYIVYTEQFRSVFFFT